MENIAKFRISSNRVLEEIEKNKAVTNTTAAKIINEMLEKSLGFDEVVLQLKKINDSIETLDFLILNVEQRLKTLSSWTLQIFVYINVVLESLKLYYDSQNLYVKNLFPQKNFKIDGLYLIEKFKLEKLLDYIKAIQDKDQ